jgi:CpeT protein
MKIIFLFIILNLTATIFSQTKQDFETLIDWMQGSYNSEEQSKNDSDYYNISLEMQKIWTDRSDGYWLYVEQAVAETKNQPYRQRIYHLVFEDNIIKSIIYSLPVEKKFIGAWKNTDLLNNLSPDSLETRVGCEVIIKRFDQNTFMGSTVENRCTSSMRGASYATTEVTITKNKLLSWDRGYNDKDEQVWGAIKGGYIFKKISK